MAELIDPEIWKETIKHSFELKSQGIDSLLLKNRGMFAHLMKFNMGLSLFENGLNQDPDDLRIVKGLFNDQPTGYGDDIENGWRDAKGINDLQYFQNLQYIETNSIPLIDEVDVSDEAKQKLMVASLSTLEEKQTIIDKHPDVFKKSFYDEFTDEIITEEESVGMGNLLRGYFRQDLKGDSSKLLWGVSEKHQEELEKDALMKIDPDFRIKEMEKENKKQLSLSDAIKKSYQDIDGFQAITLQANTLNQSEDISTTDKFDSLLDFSSAYDALHETTFSRFVEASYHDSQVETIDEALDRADGHKTDIFDYQDLADKRFKYLNTDKNVAATDEDFNRAIKSFNDNEKFNFKNKIKGKLNNYAIFESDLFNTYVKEKGLLLTKEGYQRNGKPLMENDFGNIVKDLNQRIKSNLKNLEEKIMGERAHTLYQNSSGNVKNDKITNKIDNLKQQDSELFNNFIKENDVWYEDGNYKTHSRIEEGRNFEVTNLDEKDYKTLEGQWEEEKKWKSEQSKMTDDEKNDLKKIVDKANTIDDMNGYGDKELDKVFTNNDFFEQHINDYGDLYSKYKPLNALVIAGQVSEKIEKNPNLSGSTLSIGDRNFWTKKGLYPKNADKIGYAFAANKHGKVENNRFMSDVQVKPIFTNDSFTKYGKEEKNKSKLADFYYQQTRPWFGMKELDREHAAEKGIEKTTVDIKEPIVKAATKFIVRKEMDLDKGAQFKIPGTDEINKLVNPDQRMKLLDQIHEGVKRALGIAQQDIYKRRQELSKKESLTKGQNLGKSIGKSLEATNGPQKPKLGR